MTVVQQIAATLAAAGVTRVWGMPGGDTLPLLDALRDAGLPFHLVRDETSAAFAADACAQLTGRPGACVATLGPGMTNLVTGVTGCMLDRAPVVALTSRYRADRRARYTHMMFDQGLLARATGKGHAVLSAGGAGHELDRALALARAPRPGPVWVEVPTDAALAPTPEVAPAPPPPASAGAVDPSVVALCDELVRPVILVGFGGRHADAGALADALRAPVLTTYKAKGAIPEGQGWSAGAAGLSPVVDRHHLELVARADGVILVGWDPVELRDHWLPGWGPATRVVCVDDHVPVDIPCALHAVHTGDAPAAVASLATAASGQSAWTLADVEAHRAAWLAELDEAVPGPATAVRAVQAAVHDDVVITVDTGAHRITAANAWMASRPDRMLQSNGLASMGYALPAALAAAAEGHPTVCLTGDMGLQMALGELALVAEHGLDVVVVVFDDTSLALIELKQRRRGGATDALRFANPAWPALAEAFGGTCDVAPPGPDVTAAVRRGLERGGLHLVVVPVDPGAYLAQM